MTQALTNYERGWRDSVRASITFLHNTASEMNDPHARQMLDNAAFWLGVENSQGRLRRRAEMLPRSTPSRELE